MNKFSLITTANDNNIILEQQLDMCCETWASMFNTRTPIVVESVVKILGAIQARIAANKDPLLLAPGKEQALVDLVAGIKALQNAGPQQDAPTLSKYIARVNQVKQGLQPDQAEIVAIKSIGRKAATTAAIQQAFKDLSASIVNGDHERVQELKQQFGKLYMFYQQLQNKLTHQASSNQQRQQNNTQQPSQMAGNAPPQRNRTSGQPQPQMQPPTAG